MKNKERVQILLDEKEGLIEGTRILRDIICRDKCKEIQGEEIQGPICERCPRRLAAGNIAVGRYCTMVYRKYAQASNEVADQRREFRKEQGQRAVGSIYRYSHPGYLYRTVKDVNSYIKENDLSPFKTDGSEFDL